MNKRSKNANLKSNNIQKTASQSNAQNSDFRWIDYITIELAIYSLLVGVIGLSFTLYFGYTASSAPSPQIQPVAEIINQNDNIVQAKVDDSSIDQSNNKNSNNQSDSNNWSNNSNNITLTNSNNSTTNLTKTVNQIIPKSNSVKAEDPKPSNSRQSNEDSETFAVKIPPKKIAIHSPEVYKLIRSQKISGDRFDFQQLTWQLANLKEIGLQLDFANVSQGILMAQEWIETCSVLTGQTDVWVSKNFDNSSSNRKLFDNAKSVTNQPNELGLIKSTVFSKIEALEDISETFAGNAAKILE